MKALKIIIVALLVIVGLILAVTAFLPDNVKLDSSITINANENIIFNQVNNLENWDKWSPFTYDDMIKEFAGSAYGVGAMSSWSSEEMGSGNMKIIESVSFSKISTSLDFQEDGKANGYWTFEKTEDGVEVVWAIHMTDFSYPIGKLFGLMAGSIMQPMFDQGLTQLKEVCETLDDYSGIVEEEVTEVSAFSVIDSCTINELSIMMGKNYGLIMRYFDDNDIEMTGVPFAVYHTWNPEGYTLVETGIPADNTLGGKDEIIASSLKAGKVVRFMHVGPYEKLVEGHNIIAKYMKDCGYEMGGAPYEQYYNDPTTVNDPSEIQTLISYPVL